MADNEVNIVVTATDKASSTIRGVSGSIITLNQGLELATKAFTAVKKIVDASVTAYVKYADEVRRLSVLNGTSAQETSRLIQLMDDHKVTVEALTMATRKLAQQGESLTIDSLAKMSDAYLALGNNADKTKFLLDKFGRSGFQLAETMNLGSDAIKAESDAISKNLILTQKQLDQTRAYERMLDELNDTVLGYTVVLGSKLLPLQIGLTRKLIEGTDAWGGFGGQIQQIADILMTRTNPALVGFGTALAYARGFLNMPEDALNMWLGLDEIASELATETLPDLGAGLEDVGKKAMDMSGELDSILSFGQNYRQSQEDMMTLEGELAEARKRGYSETGTKILEIKGKIEEVKAAQTEWTNKFILDMAMMQAAADGISPEEAQGLLKMAEQLGLIDDSAINAYDNLMRLNGLDISNTVTTTFLEIRESQTVSKGGIKGKSMRASGGSIPPGGTAWVGDSPGGLTPYSELVYAPHGAQVFKASESRAMASGAPRAVSGGVIPAMTGETNLSYSTIRQLASAIAGEMSRING
jgi:hypothetical protein